MLRAVIIDDESSGLISLELLIKKYTDNVKVVAAVTDAAKAIDLINDYRPEIVFLDIQMPNLDGFEMLQRLTFRGFHLVFTTAHKSYALRALKQGAVDYLLKPVDPAELKQAVERVNQKIQELNEQPDVEELLKDWKGSQSQRIDIRTKTGIEFVEASQVMYIEASSNRTNVVLADGCALESAKGLKDYETQLCTEGSSFIRIHNSFIINVNYVNRYLREDGGYAVIDKKSIPVSKARKDDFLKMINFGPRR